MSVWSKTYIKKLLFKIAMIFLIVGGLHCFYIGLFDKSAFGSFSRIIYIFVGISALVIMFDRDTYLPFLGPTVIPCSVLEIRDPPDYTREVKIVVEPNVKIIYWATEPSKKTKSWKKAYGDYQNAGVTISNGEGIAVFKVREPSKYKVPIMGKLKPHIHYRVCGEAGWMGRINTIFLDKHEVTGI